MEVAEEDSVGRRADAIGGSHQAQPQKSRKPPSVIR